MIIKMVQKFHLQLFIPLFIFCLLLARNPFSERSLIPNLEPYPDSFHYVLPARCFITTGQWSLCRSNMRGRESEVAPLYSVVLIPFYLLSVDPRVFYFANVLLSLASFIFLYQLFRKLKVHPVIQFSVLLLAATRYHLYWYPTLAMAENLIIFLFLLNLWLLLTSKLWLKILSVFTALGFYATKYAFAPLTVVFLVFNFFSLWHYKKKLPRWMTLLCLIGGLAGLAVLIKSRSMGSLFSSNFFALTLSETQMQHTWFSLAYLPSHLPKYLGSLFGKPTLVLWDTRVLLPWFFSWLSLGGLIGGLFKKHYRLISLAVIISLLAQMLFISTFYAFDSRYTFHTLYALLLGLAIGCSLIIELFSKYKKYFLIMVPCLTILFLLSEVKTLRQQLAINFKYAETPWYYVATKHIDSVVTPVESETIVASAVPVYFFDFFTNGHYTVLPISIEQERTQQSLVYGEQYTYTDLPALYIQLLTEGKTVFISNYGLGNQGYMHEAYAAILEKVDSELISEGCYSACNVYKLRLKKTE